MTTEWENTSRSADGWGASSMPVADLAPLPPPPPSPEELEAKKQEKKRLEAEREEAAKEDAERRDKLRAAAKAEAARVEQERLEEKRAEDKKVRDKRREERNGVRLKTLQRGFLIDQFADTCRRVRDAVKPNVHTALLACALILAGGLTYKILTMDFNAFAKRPVIVQPVGPMGPGGGGVLPGGPGADPNGGTGPDGNGRGKVAAGPSPDGDGSPDDPKGAWGWDKYFKNGQKVQPAQ